MFSACQILPAIELHARSIVDSFAMSMLLTQLALHLWAKQTRELSAEMENM